MIGRLRGMLVAKHAESVVLDVAGVGYEIAVTPRGLIELPGIDAVFSKTEFKSYELIGGWTYDSRNRALFADRGAARRAARSAEAELLEVDGPALVRRAELAVCLGQFLGVEHCLRSTA